MTTNPTDRHPDNAPGPWHVNENCIGCDLCEENAPAIFRRSAVGDHNIVHHQPATPDELLAAGEALELCPVEAISSAA